MFNYLKSTMSEGTVHSSRRMSLVVSVLVAALLVVCIGIAILYDVFKDGVVDSELKDFGYLLLCAGGYIAGSGLNKAISDSKMGKNEIKKD